MTEYEKTKKLESLPWQALFDLACEKKIDEAKIRGKEKSIIISTLLSSAVISDSEIEILVNDYIYGDRVTFTLWNFEKNLSPEHFDIISNLEGAFEPYLQVAGFRGLSVLSTTNYSDRIEILYVYSKEYPYIDEDGKSASVWEQHRGCLWLGVQTKYLACISKHDRMTSCIVNFISEKIRIPLTQVKPPKSAIERCIRQIAVSRIVLQGTGGEKTIISRSEGLTATQHEEIRRIKDGRFDTSGSYIAKITEDAEATVKYNVKKGSIGIYKHLPASILFSWSQTAIDIIFEEINKLKGRPAKEIFKELGLEIKWPYLSIPEKEAAEWFLSKAIACLDSEEDVVFSIPDSVQSLLCNPLLFTVIPKIYCEPCGSYETPVCSECGAPLQYSSQGKLYCSCGAPLRIRCSEGHSAYQVENWFIPTPKMTTMIFQNIHNAFKQDSLDLAMCVMGNTLYISHFHSLDADMVEIHLNEIECFSGLPAEPGRTSLEFAARLGEKCNGSCSDLKVCKCTSDNTMACLPKAFYTVLPGFRPQPHKGLEYGDISAEVKTANRTYEMKGIIKKNSKNTGRKKSFSVLASTHLLSTSKEGQEIIRQFVEQGLNDRRAELIAVIAPQYFDNSLKGTLRFLAKLGGKKVLFIELDEIARIIEKNESILVVET